MALTTDHIIKWAQLLEVNPGDIAPALSTLNFTPIALRRVKVPILASMSGKPVAAFEIVEISTRMIKQLYGISVDDDSLGVYARKGATLIISQEEEPVAGDEVFVRLKLQDRHLHLVKEFVAVDASTGKALLKPLFGGEVEEYSLDAIEIMDPIISVERPVVVRPPRKRESHLTLV